MIKFPKTFGILSLVRQEIAALQKEAKQLNVFWNIVLYVITFTFFMFLLLVLFWHEGEHYISLAYSFIHGKLYFIQSWDQIGGPADTTLWNGRYFWPAGPLPSIISIPFVFVLGTNIFTQGLLKFLLAGGSFLLLYLLAIRSGVKKKINALWLTLGFVMATCYTTVLLIPISMNLGHIATLFFFLLVLWEYLGKQRWWLIGCLISAMFLCRATLLMAFIPFVLFAWSQNLSTRQKIKSCLELVSPLLVSIVIYALYNYARYGNILETGYGIQYGIGAVGLLAISNWGTLNIKYIPANIYYFLFHGPLLVASDIVPIHAKFPFIKADPFGMSIFITSPLLVLAVKNKLTKQSKIIWLGIVGILAGIFCFWGIGRVQYGYRYALDVYPLLFLLTTQVVATDEKKYMIWVKRSILFGFIANLYLGLPLFLCLSLR